MVGNALIRSPWVGQGHFSRVARNEGSDKAELVTGVNSLRKYGLEGGQE